MIELLDTTVLSNFALVGATAIFFEVLQAPAIPQEVLTEAEAGVQLGLVPATDWSQLSVLIMTEQEQLVCHDLGTQLGAGEAACLAIAAIRGGCACVGHVGHSDSSHS